MTTSVESVLMAVRTGILGHSVITLAETGITAETVLMFVLLPVRLVDTDGLCTKMY